MKLRVKGDTMRFRLSELEVNQLQQGNQVADKIHFPSATFTYIVQPSASTTIDFIDNEVLLTVNREDVGKLAKSDQVSIVEVIIGSNGNNLSILVEKDFKCLSRRAEDESELYPNPNSHKC